MGLIKRKEPNLSKQQAFMFFTTVADVGALCVALIYISYVVLLMAVLGFTTWLNWTMLGITIAYILFFLYKIFFLNRTMKHTGRIKRTVKIANKYTKLGMRLINATFVILSLIGTQLNDSHTLALVGVLIVGMTFLTSILWDIGNFIVRRKIQEFTVSWNKLSHEEKTERIELLVSGFLRSINNAAVVDDYFDIGLSVKRMVGEKMGEKMGDRIRLADARRATHVDEVGNGEEVDGNEDSEVGDK